MQNDNDSNAGAATPGTGNPTDPGSSQVTPGAPSGTPDNQNGTPTTQGDEEKTRMREEIRRLNAAVVEAKRGSRNNPQANPEDDPFGTPEGKYGMAIQVATSNLRNKLEDLIPLYPELPADQISRIRKNPWAFTKLETYQNGDWETAALEIETAMVDEAEKLAAAKPPVTTPNPADISNNPTPDTGDEPVVIPGSPEDEDDWTMPLDKLEAKKNKAVAKVSQNK